MLDWYKVWNLCFDTKEQWEKAIKNFEYKQRNNEFVIEAKDSIWMRDLWFNTEKEVKNFIDTAKVELDNK